MPDSVEPTIADAYKLVSTPPEAPKSFKEWWSSDWGPGPLLALALPLMISTGFMSLTLFTDRTLLYWQSEEAASAAMGAGALYWTLSCFPLGLLGYVSTFVSQYVGAQRYERIPVVVHHAMRLAWMLVPVFVLAAILAYVPFIISGHKPEMIRLEGTYLRVLLIGGIASLFTSAQAGLLTGLGRTAVVMMVDAISTGLNFVLALLLIFGWGPVPAMGVLGAAIATAISLWVKAPLLYLWMRSDARIRDLIFRPRVQSPSGRSIAAKIPWEPGIIKRLVLYGAPSGLQMLAESSAFTIILMQVGRLSELEMAATTLALGLNVLAFVPMMGLGIGVGVLVGKHLLEKRIDLAQRTVNISLVMSVIYTFAFAIALGLFPEQMSVLYAMGSKERFDQIRPILIPLLRVIALYCVLDGFQLVFVGAIKGAGDTWFVLLGTTAVAFGAVITGLIAEQFFGSSLMLWWYVIAGWVGAMLLAFGGRYMQGKWKTMQVIEHEAELE